MILDEQLIGIGRFLKPHGIAGEINFEPDYDLELPELRCIVVDIDGIYVPFFVEKARKKGTELQLVKIDGLDNEKQVALLARKEVFALKDDVDIEEEATGSNGFSAYDFEGFTMIDISDESVIGTVDYIDDTTDNWLFIVKHKDTAKPIQIPVADEFIAWIDPEKKEFGVNLPAGLLEL